MILEAIVTTLSLDGILNIAPMGPQVEGTDLQRFELRPYRTSTTYHNLKATRAGVLHVTDDVLLLARAAIGQADGAPSRPADVVSGKILVDACRYYEFRVVDLDDHVDRATIQAETVASGRVRDFFGFNRAKHAVVEAAILATRMEFLPMDEIREEYRKLSTLVARTGGLDEQLAFMLLDDFVRESARARGLDPDAGSS